MTFFHEESSEKKWIQTELQLRPAFSAMKFH